MQVDIKPIIYKKKSHWQKYLVPRDWQDKAWEFSGKSNSVEYYAKQRNGAGRRVQRGQNFMGKIGEYASSQWIKDRIGMEIEVDLNIYNSQDKSWEADLPYTKMNLPINVHVKSCAQFTNSKINTYPVSWIFQYKNTSSEGGLDDLFVSGSDKDYVCLTYVKIDEPVETNGACICAFLPWSMIEPILRDPMREDKKSLKKCLYWEDIVKTYGDSEYAV